MAEKREGDPFVQLSLDSALNKPPQPPIAKAPPPVTVEIIRPGDPDYESPMEVVQGSSYQSPEDKRK